MYFSRLLVSAVFFSGSIQMVHAAEPEEYVLGGARDARVRIEHADRKLRCSVSFLPVKAFGAPKNRELNRIKARQYCVRALITRIGAARGQGVEIDGLTIVDAGRMDGIRYLQTYEVPAANVRLAGDSAAKKTDPQIESESGNDKKAGLNAGGKGGLLSRATDHQDMIDQIANDLECGIVISKRPDLDILVASKEEEILGLFEGCLREVSSDNLLLKIEKDRLASYISEKRSALIRILKTAYEKATSG